jgi:capsular polysaccharide biosynthesis protein
LILMTLLALVSSIIVSLFIQNKYESTVVLFPTTTSSIAKALISENNTGKEDVLRLGEEEQAEQMLQVLYSDEIRNRIIEKYDLVHHYDIDDDVEYKYTRLQKEYESNVTFNRTKFMSVEINVLDHNPDTAAMIANDIADLLDTVNSRMRKEIASEALKIVQDEFNDQIAYNEFLEDSIRYLRRKGIIDIEVQVERYTEQMATAILEGKVGAAKLLEAKLDTLSEYAGLFAGIRDQLYQEKKRLSVIRTKLREAKIDAERHLQSKFVVNRAFPAEKKSYPIRWLIVVISTFSTFLLTLVCVLFLESIKSIKFN